MWKFIHAAENHLNLKTLDSIAVVRTIRANTTTSQRRSQSMTTKTPDQTTSEQKRDPDLVNAEIALKRAADKAREIARKAGTSVVILKDGEIREEQGDNYVHSDH
jgi:hypothetical protein